MLTVDIEPALGLFGLGAARALPLAWSIPVFGGPALPVRLRVVLGLGLAALCYPVLAASSPPTGVVAWVLLAGREALVGVVMGLVCAGMFRAAEGAGALLDELHGTHGSLATAPGDTGAMSSWRGLLLLLACVIFLEIGGIAHLATALTRSYEAIPLDQPVRLHTATQSAARLAVVASSKLIEASIGLAAPALVALLLADIVLGALDRAVPRIALHFASRPLKALVVVGVVLLGLGGMDLAMQAGFRGFFDLLQSGLRFGR